MKNTTPRSQTTTAVCWSGAVARGRRAKCAEIGVSANGELRGRGAQRVLCFSTGADGDCGRSRQCVIGSASRIRHSGSTCFRYVVAPDTTFCVFLLVPETSVTLRIESSKRGVGRLDDCLVSWGHGDGGGSRYKNEHPFWGIEWARSIHIITRGIGRGASQSKLRCDSSYVR